MSGEKHLEIVIVGGGIAGLAIAYGLLSLPRVRVRIFERRKGRPGALSESDADDRNGLRPRRISDPSIGRECLQPLQALTAGWPTSVV